jgi:hypothetical protein
MRRPSVGHGWAAVVVVTAAVVLASATPSASASPVRSCGDIPETSHHLAIYDVTTRGLHCPTARSAALQLFRRCGTRCTAVGRRFTCRNLGQDEEIDQRCVSRRVVVRFQTGV